MQETSEQNIIIINNSTIDIEDITNILKNIFDPEIYFSIYDIGLIYKIEATNEKIIITMTLTSVNCPEAQSIPDEVFKCIQEKFPDKEVIVDLTFEPAWTVENMADEVKLKLGLL